MQKNHVKSLQNQFHLNRYAKATFPVVACLQQTAFVILSSFTRYLMSYHQQTQTCIIKVLRTPISICGIWGLDSQDLYYLLMPDVQYIISDFKGCKPRGKFEEIHSTEFQSQTGWERTILFCSFLLHHLFSSWVWNGWVYSVGRLHFLCISAWRQRVLCASDKMLVSNKLVMTRS